MFQVDCAGYQSLTSYSPTFPFATTAKVKAVLMNGQQYMVLLNSCPLALVLQSTAVASFLLLLLRALSICDGSVGIVTGLPDHEVPLHTRLVAMLTLQSSAVSTWPVPTAMTPQ